VSLGLDRDTFAGYEYSSKWLAGVGASKAADQFRAPSPGAAAALLEIARFKRPC
jgi:hypothetical protein